MLIRQGADLMYVSVSYRVQVWYKVVNEVWCSVFKTMNTQRTKALSHKLHREPEPGFTTQRRLCKVKANRRLLPVEEMQAELLTCINCTVVTIAEGATGSGEYTQVSKCLMNMPGCTV